MSRTRRRGSRGLDVLRTSTRARSGVVEGGDEGDAAEGVADEGGDDVAADHFRPRLLSVPGKAEHLDGPGDNMAQVRYADDIRDDDDHPDPRRLGERQQPDDQRDEPAG